MFGKREFRETDPYSQEVDFEGKPLRKQKQETVIKLPRSVHEPFQQRETRFDINRGLGLHGSCRVQGMPRQTQNMRMRR